MDIKKLILLKKLYDPILFDSYEKISKKNYNIIKSNFDVEEVDFEEFGIIDKDIIILENDYIGFRIIKTIENENLLKLKNGVIYSKEKIKECTYRIHFSKNSILIINSLLEKFKIKESLNILENEKTKRRL